jgi:hypothetical protein
MRKLLMRPEDYYDSRSSESVSTDSLNKKALSKNAINEKGACHVDD